jgi:hypothetical protein
MICNRPEKVKKANQIEELKISFYDSIHSVNTAEWAAFNANQNIYLSPSYLQVVEGALKEELQFSYILFHNSNGELVATAYLQLAKFIDTKANYQDSICRVQGILKSTILKKLEVNVLVCGNIFACGENGFMYSSQLSASTAYFNLNKALNQLKKAEHHKEFSILLMKEFWPATHVERSHLLTNNYSDFSIDVNMVLKIHPSWNDFDAYLQCMTTKFRTRAKGVFKKSKVLVKQSFNASDIAKHEKRIDELYGFVLTKSDFNFGTINAKVFAGFKEHLKENFSFTGYFLNEVLIGFSTSMLSNGTMDANFVGLDYQYNNQYAVYQRMLYDFVEVAIKEQLTELRLGRTAEEIKSCLGAEPVTMKLYLKHKKSVPNKIIKQLIKSVKPSEFELRKPFKARFN